MWPAVVKRKQVVKLPTDDHESPCQQTPCANPVRYATSGKYFARNRVAGKLIRQRLSLFFQFEMNRQRGLVSAVELKPEGG